VTLNPLAFKVPAAISKETAHKYILGLYEILERITSQFPEVLFECSCQGCRPSDSPDQVGSRSGLPPLSF
jgi:alpha-galactosidase